MALTLHRAFHNRAAPTLALILVLSTLLAHPLPAAGANINQTKKGALVVVVFSAVQNENSKCVACPIATRSTGFFVDDAGTVVTTYHGLTELPDIDESTLTIEVITGDVLANLKRRAFKSYFDAARDILVLTVAGDWTGIPFFRASANPTAEIALGQTVVLTSGYPAAYPYQALPGTVTGFFGPLNEPWLWTTNINFIDGQSGSPVYLDDGRLIGMAKGTDKDRPSVNLMVPVMAIRNLIPAYIQVEGAPVAAAPSPAGTVKVSADVQTSAKVRQPRSVTVTDSNSRCQGSRVATQHFASTPGASIDSSSIQIRLEASSVGATIFGLSNMRPEGFDVQVLLTNPGQCVEVFGTVVGPDVPAKAVTRADYVEVREATSSRTVDLAQVPVGKESDIHQQLPPDATGYTVTYQDPNGAITSLRKDGLLPNLDNAGKLSVQLDEATRSLNLKIFGG